MFRMKDAKLVSKSLVFLDTKFMGLLPSQVSGQLNSSPFYGINKVILEKTLRDMDIDLQEEESSHSDNDFGNRHSFCNDTYTFIHDYLPPKFNIIHKTNYNDNSNINKIAKELLSYIDIKKIGVMGINFEFRIPITDFNYKTEIVNKRFSRELEGLNIKLSYPNSNKLVDFCLNITISKESDNPECLKILSNFHCVDIPNKPIESILDHNWLEIIHEKLTSFDT